MLPPKGDCHQFMNSMRVRADLGEMKMDMPEALKQHPGELCRELRQQDVRHGGATIIYLISFINVHFPSPQEHLFHDNYPIMKFIFLYIYISIYLFLFSLTSVKETKMGTLITAHGFLYLINCVHMDLVSESLTNETVREKKLVGFPFSNY